MNNNNNSNVTVSLTAVTAKVKLFLNIPYFLNKPKARELFMEMGGRGEGRAPHQISARGHDRILRDSC